MSAKIMGHVWELDLPANKLLVLLALADHADHEGQNVFPSLKLVAWKTGYSESQTRRIIKSLVQDGVLVEEAAPDGKPKVYSIHLEVGKRKGDYKKTPVTAMIPPQNDTPSIAMTPQGLHSYDTPTPVTAMTPKPLDKPSNKPSYINARAKQNKKRLSKKQQFLVNWTDHQTTGEALLTAFGHDLKFRGVEHMSVASCQPYLEAATDLDESAFPVSDVPALYSFVECKAKKESWSGFSVKSLPKYAEDYLRSKIQLVKAPTRKITQEELDAKMPSASDHVVKFGAS